ncbi:WbqC family protein [Winogradskyella sp. 3972H.M.0a.05]|uniref:WbqC family protein n=1 Tax=Winogradskyella sp. 3972H.M.0a.05 TaxID=2950277 RepID=UPI003397E188
MLLHLAYFPNIAHFASMVQSDAINFEVCDTYTKQTYRNRACIYGANGKLQLNIPVNHSQKERQLYKDVRIANDTKWQSQHLKSLQSAYRTSPFYEYYEDELSPLFETKAEFLMDFNFKCLNVIADCLQLDLNYTLTETFKKDSIDMLDYRSLIHCKKEVSQNLQSYTQVFSDKHGFIDNLSILDLLFNEGPNALNYLEQQHIVN